MSMQTAPRLVRRLKWADADLVEGTEAMLWPASSAEDAEAPPPDSADAVHGVLSWARPKVLRFETTTPEPLPDLLLVSTLSVDGPAMFVVRKTYQIGPTAACEPPREIHIVERRDLFRVPVAAKVTLAAASRTWELSSLDCSLGGMRVCPPANLAVGSQVEVKVELHNGHVLNLVAEVRHSHLFQPLGAAAAKAPRLGPARVDSCDACPTIVGLQFLSVPAESERRLGEFVSRHQRRLMPRTRARLPMEYCPEQRAYYLETFASEISPGDLVFETRKAHVPGERMKVRARLGRRDYEFGSYVVASHSFARDEGGTGHCVRVSLDEGSDAQESLFRKAVRDLAIERMGSRA